MNGMRKTVKGSIVVFWMNILEEKNMTRKLICIKTAAEIRMKIKIYLPFKINRASDKKYCSFVFSFSLCVDYNSLAVDF